jgi:hypothetical protein
MTAPTAIKVPFRAQQQSRAARPQGRQVAFAGKKRTIGCVLMGPAKVSRKWNGIRDNSVVVRTVGRVPATGSAYGCAGIVLEE